MDELHRAFAELEREAPHWMVRYIRWLHSPKSRKYRIPLGLLLIACGTVGFLPIVGYEFIPLGLLVLAQDIRCLRKPMGKMVLWLLSKWVKIKKRWQHSHKH